MTVNIGYSTLLHLTVNLSIATIMSFFIFPLKLLNEKNKTLQDVKKFPLWGVNYHQGEIMYIKDPEWILNLFISFTFEINDMVFQA